MMDRGKSAVWRSVYPLMRPHLGAIILLNILTLLQSMAQVALAVITKFLIDAVLSGSDRVWGWAISLVVTLLSIVVLHIVFSWCTGSTADQCVARMRQALLAAANRSDGMRLQEFHSGALLSRGMEDVHTLCNGFVVTLPSVVGQLTQLIGAFSAIIVLYPSIAPLLFLACAVIVGVTAVLRPVMRRQHRQVRSADEQVMAQLQEDLQQLELVQSLQMEQQSQNRFARWVRDSLSARRKRRVWSVSISAFLSLCSQLGTGVLLLWCATRVAAHAMSYGALTALLQLLAMLRSPVMGLSGMWNRLSAIDVAAERLYQLLKEPAETDAPAAVCQVKAVVFENVTFHYPGDEAPVLAQFCARFPLERWTCLTGISGKGKSTIFKLILGLYAPQEGRVYLETDRGQILCGKHTRHLFAYVPQDYSLFSGTILENLLLAAPEADEAQRRFALRAAQADFVWELPASEQAQVRENNTGLSKGQLQRLAIARAVLMDRPIFLLDECTSALDAQTESRLLEALGALGKQAILVTHRTNALQNAPGITFVEMDT